MSRQNYTTQLETIFGMLSHGHNSIRLEAHTLPLWSITVGSLIGFTGLLADTLTPILFSNSQEERDLFIQIFIGSVILLAIFIDRYLIIKCRRQRDESISPLQKKINNINWIVSGSGVLIVMFASQNFMGSHELFGLYIIMSGFCLYVCGLFSYPWLRWAGIIQMTLGICALFLFTFKVMQIYSACSFIIGGTLIHFLNNDNLNTKQLIIRSMIWIAAIWLTAGSVYYGHYKLYIESDHLPVISLEQYSGVKVSSMESIVVSIPKGTIIPFEYNFEFDLFTENIAAKWDMKLKYIVDIVMRNGEPTGIYRINNGTWRRRNDSLEVSSFIQKYYIDPIEGPTILREVTIRTNRNYPGLNL